MAGEWETVGKVRSGDEWESVTTDSAPSKLQSVVQQGADWLSRKAAERIIDVNQARMGVLQGAANIGSTLLAPVDYAVEKVTGEPINRRQRIKGFIEDRADPSSPYFQGGQLATEIAATAGIGGALAKGATALGLTHIAPKLATALESGGFGIGQKATTAAGKIGDVATRIGAGAMVGGASAGLVDPESAGVGAMIGSAAPYAIKAAGAAGSALRPGLDDAVSALARRAEQLGIRIPADRIINNRPLNAAAASLNYVPFSGRAATEDRMFSQFNRAISRTIGQDSDNVSGALRKANLTLGNKFDDFLKGNNVAVDETFLADLAKHAQRAGEELGDEGARIIGKQIDAIIAKADSAGKISGQAAYNIKKTLDRIGRRSSNEAFYALDLKRSLMDALDRSVGPESAAGFKELRQQYGNMLALEKVAKRGAEGGISIAKLANAPSGRINSPDLQELADIAAQFMVTREAPHGAAQRVVMGGLAAGMGVQTGTLPVIAGGIAAARGANTALNSEAMRRFALGETPKAFYMLDDPMARALLYQGANVTSRAGQQ